MLNTDRKVKYLTDKDEAEFLSKITNVKYRLGALIMLDCGLRISELCHIKVKDMNFQKKEMYVLSLKKGKDKSGKQKEVWRTVGLTDRVVQCAADYFVAVKTKKKMQFQPNDWLFPSPTKDGPIHRQQFWRYFDHVSDGRVYNHLMRHTCATKLLSAGVDLIVARDILGHQSVSTTEIYTHAAKDKLLKAAQQIQKQSRFKIWSKRLFPSLYKMRNIHALPVQHGWTKFHIGRKEELLKLHELAEKRVNILMTGKQGVGKSHLLDNFIGHKILRVDDTKNFNKSLAGMLIKIIDGEAQNYVKTQTDVEADDTLNRDGWTEIAVKPESKEVLLEMLGAKKEVITKYSQKRLTELMISLTEPGEYTIIIDSVDHVTPTVVAALEFLRNHFHFIVAARNIKVEAATWLTNFQRIEIKPLKRDETMKLITKASESFRQNIEDWDAYCNHIWLKCSGNPQFSLELIDRFSKEVYVSAYMVSTTDHTTVDNEISATPLVLIGLGIVIVGKFWSREAMPDDREAFLLFGGIATLFLIFGRMFAAKLKRKYL